MSKTRAEVEAIFDAIFDYENREARTTTKKVVVKEPVEVVKEVIKEVEKDCPEPEPCPDCPEEQVVYVDTLKVKGGGDIYVKGKNKNSSNKSAIKRPDWMPDSWVLGEGCEISTPQEVIVGAFAVVPLAVLQPSHLPPDFAPNPKNPYNERDYQKNKSERGKVIKNAKKFNPKFLINDDNTPENGAIIIDKKGVVLGGNGRTMSLLLVVQEFPEKYEKYYELLLKKCSCFGIDAEQITGIENPVLVRVAKTDDNKPSAYYSRIFNESMKQKMDTLDTAIGIIKSLGNAKIKAVVTQISEYLNGRHLSLYQVMGQKKVMKEFLTILQNNSVINDENRDTFLDADGDLKDDAYLIITYMFYAMVFDNRRDIEYVIENDFIKIEQVYGLLLDIKTLKKPYNIFKQFSSALEKMSAGKKSSDEKIEADELYMQANMYSEYQVRYIEYLCMKLLEMRDDKKQKEVLQNYINLVNGLTDNFFADEKDDDAKVEKLLEMAFDEAKVKHKLANLGDRKPAKRKKKGFACMIEFVKRYNPDTNTLTALCYINNMVGMSSMQIKTKYKKHYDNMVFGWALKNLCREYNVIPNWDSVDGISALLSAIDLKYGTKFSYSDFKYKGNRLYLENLECDGVFEKNMEYYTPKLFDKKRKKQTKNKTKLSDSKPKSLGERFITWLKKDWNQPYKWRK